jgi:Fanconi anemia group J protein
VPYSNAHSQVVRELKKTGYVPSMAILAARRHYCINRKVVQSGRVDELCEELGREEFGCRFHNRRQAGTTDALTLSMKTVSKGGVCVCGKGGTCKVHVGSSLTSCRLQYHSSHSLLHTALQLLHDVEDLITAGRRHKHCPYYASRSMAQSAELVLCPYQVHS